MENFNRECKPSKQKNPEQRRESKILFGIPDPEFFGLIASAIIAVLLTFLIQYLKDRNDRLQNQKTLATLLGYEIEAIRQQANQVQLTIERYLPTIEPLLKQVNDTKLPFNVGISITDADYPTNVYDRPTINLGLFDLDTAFLITELYRWCKFEDQLKRNIANIESDVREILANNIGQEPIKFINSWRAKALLMLNSAKSYSGTTTTIQSLAAQCLTHIQEYVKIDVSRVKILQAAPAKPQLANPNSVRKATTES